MVAKTIRVRIWQEMWDVERFLHYYEALTNRWAVGARGVRASFVIGAALSIGALTEALPVEFGYVAAIALLVGTVLDIVFEWGTRAALSHATSTECFVVRNEYMALWTKMEGGLIEDAEIDATSQQLLSRLTTATARLPDTNKKISQAAQDASAVTLKWRFPNGTEA